MNQNFKTHIITILLKDDRLKDEQGELKGNVLKEFVNTLDEKIITILLNDTQTRSKFFLKIKDAYVFKTNEFKFFLDENSIDNSFTQYSNQIGLASGGKFLKNNTDVVLNFPFKDCVLEGGQSTEDGLDTYFEYDEEQEDYIEKQSKRKEIFFNEVLAKDEIDRLLEPKAFTNITKYDSKGESKPTKFNRNAKGTITDNLIIKGNNLLALKSLKQEFKGKVKLIYIDPPYYFREVKQEDTFTYNSNFRLSSWLSFMYSRLIVAKDLLTNDGVFFVSINEDGLCYLKLLLDELFGIENFIEIFNWKKTDTPSNLPNKSKKVSEYIICYEKKKDNVKFCGLQKTSKSNDPLTKPKNAFKILEFQPGVLICSDTNKKYLKGENYGTEKYPMELINDLTIENNTNVNKVKFKNRFTWTQTYLDNELLNKTKLFCSKKTLVISYKKENYEVEAPFDLIDSSMGIQTSENAGKELTKMFGKEVFKYPKTESLMQYLIGMVANKFTKNDIVLDFHVGSGTTSATAHKLGLQYIGIEQLDYINTLTIPRLEKVIRGEQSGISKPVNWKGGGSFVYLELAKNNQTAKEAILKCENLEELLKFFETMYTQYFLHYNVRIKQFKETISKEENFKNLALDRQKEIFSKMLDLNQLYVNLSELEDSRYQIDAKDIALSKDFYQVKT